MSAETPDRGDLAYMAVAGRALAQRCADIGYETCQRSAGHPQDRRRSSVGTTVRVSRDQTCQRSVGGPRARELRPQPSVDVAVSLTR